MKHITLIFNLILLLSLNLFSQTPTGFNYQGIARDAAGNELVITSLDVKLSIRTGTMNGAIEWQETHDVTTNDFGLYTIVVGEGTSTGVGTFGNFSDIPWSTANHFLQVEINFGTGLLDMGTTQLLAVPYSFISENVVNNDDADADPENELQVISISNDTVYLSDGGFIELPEDQLDDADADPANEFQIISRSNDTIYLSNGGFVVLPSSNSFWTDNDTYINANNITSTSKVVVSDDGFLGIGTTEPLGEIHVNKPIGFSGFTFSGSGINDITINYEYFNGTGDINYIVYVLNTGPNPDLIKWSDDNGVTWTENIDMANSGVDIGNGVTIGFTAVDGHNFGDEWSFVVSEGFMDGFIVKDGKVGIGNQEPTEKLDVNGNIKATAFYGDGSTLTGIASGTGGVVNTGSTTIAADSDANDTGEIVFQTEGTTKITIDNDGNLGIGTTTPETKLDVAGSITANTKDDNTDVSLTLKGKNTDFESYTYQSDTSQGINISMNRARGNMTTPEVVIENDKLGEISALGYDGSNFIKASSITFEVDSAVNVNSVPGNIVFNTSPVNSENEPEERMRINNNGKIGIGTDLPTEQLEVNGNIKASAFVGDGSGLTGIAGGTGGVSNAGSTTIAADNDSDGVGEIAFQTKDSTRLTITNNGYIGIGTISPKSQFEIISDKDESIDSTFIYKNGKVGIGTSNPAEDLEVIGTFKADTLKGDGSYLTGLAYPYLGEVKMFAISLTGAITKENLQADGWAICDGTTATVQGITGALLENTPDLQAKFIRMSSDESSGNTGGSDSHNHKWFESSLGYAGGSYLSNGTSTSEFPFAGVYQPGTGNRYWEGDATSTDYYTTNTNNIPIYYELAFFIKVK